MCLMLLFNCLETLNVVAVYLGLVLVVFACIFYQAHAAIIQTAYMVT